MQSDDIAHSAHNVKPFPQVTHTGRPWLAMAHDLVDHEVVGMHVRPPKAADANRHAQQPMVMWLWMLRETAHKERKRM
ncbi:MAG TPA: hypothetical protein VFH51_15460, partial [Myxococcota bacterium]|nr:hypothetical protein [Myxococcota bacterium]